MSRNTKIIGISPGTRYIGYSVFYGSELMDWGIKNMEGRWSKAKLAKIMTFMSDLIGQHKPNVLSIKLIHPSRSSGNLNQLIAKIKESANRKQIKIRRYSIKDLETFFCGYGRINKKTLAKKVAEKYPVLFNELNREKSIRNPYYIRMFEAVALGSLCLSQQDKRPKTSSHHKNHDKT